MKAVARCFDRVTSLPVAASALKSFKQVISLYHLHPESKFLNGEYLDRGVTQRRYVYATAIRNIGKEANEWEPQFYLGFDEDEQIEYGIQRVKATARYFESRSSSFWRATSVGKRKWCVTANGIAPYEGEENSQGCRSENSAGPEVKRSPRYQRREPLGEPFKSIKGGFAIREVPAG
jgi:hypothetical protein